MLNINQIASYPLFRDLSTNELEALAACMSKRTVAKGAYIFHPGSPAMNLYLVESGMMRIFFCNSKGEEFLLNLMRPGSIIGHPLLMENQIRILGASAQLPSTLLTLAHDDILRLMKSSRQLTLNLYIDLSATARKLLLHYQSFISTGLEGRTAALFIHLGEENADEISLPISQADLASWLGVSRGRLNLTLIKFQKQGLIRLDGTSLCILDRERLSLLAEEAA